MSIIIKHGLDIPIEGSVISNNIHVVDTDLDFVDFRDFRELSPIPILKEGDPVSIGEPIAFLKHYEEMKIVSNSSGKIDKITRGDKRSLSNISVRVSNDPVFFKNEQSLSPDDSVESLIKTMNNRGLSANIKLRPFNIPAIPPHLPRDIFINLAENAPLSISPEDSLLIFDSIEEKIKIIRCGIMILTKIIGKPPHIIIRKNSFKQIEPHIKDIAILKIIEGPYPSGNSSVHIHRISPIKHEKDFVWTLSINELINIGHMSLYNTIVNKKIIGLFGNGTKDTHRHLIKTNIGATIKPLINNSIIEHECTIISGNPMTGDMIVNIEEGFIRNKHSSISIIKKEVKRSMFHFLRLGFKRFSAHNVFIKNSNKKIENTNVHGSLRAFIDSSIYDKFMPIRIPTVMLVKAILAEDFESAISFGMLEVCDEDFALSSFVCPSKIDFINIVKNGITKYVKESGLLSVS